MWIIVAEDGSNGLIRGHSDGVDCGGVEESVDAIGCDVFISVVVMIDNVVWVLIE